MAKFSERNTGFDAKRARLDVLDRAINCAEIGERSQVTVERAQAFYEFVMGDDDDIGVE